LFYKFNSLLVIYIPIFILTLWFSQVSVSFAVNSNNTVGLRGLKKAAENSLMFTEFYSLNYLRECAFVRNNRHNDGDDNNNDNDTRTELDI